MRKLRAGKPPTESGKPAGQEQEGGFLYLSDHVLQDLPAEDLLAGKRRRGISWQVLLTLAVLAIGMSLILLLLYLVLDTLEYVGEQQRLEAQQVQIMATSLAPDSVPKEQVDIVSNYADGPILADGEHAVQISFSVMTAGAGPAADGTVVRFEAAGGQVAPHLAGTEDGVAHTWFTPALWQEGRDQAEVAVRAGEIERAFALPLAKPPDLASLRFQAASPKMKVGNEIRLEILALATDQQPKNGVTLAIRSQPPGVGRIEPAIVSTQADGLASIHYAAGRDPGWVTLIAEEMDGSGISSTFELDILPDINHLELALSKETLYAAVDDEAVLAVLVSDALDVPLHKEPIRLEVISGEGWLVGDDRPSITGTKRITVTTDRHGTVLTTYRPGLTPGKAVIRADAAGQRQEAILRVERLQPVTLTISAEVDEVQVNQTTMLQVSVLDQRGQPMPKTAVTFELPSTHTGYLGTTPTNYGYGSMDIVTKDTGVGTAYFIPRYTGVVTITATAGKARGDIVLDIVESSPEG